MIAEVARRLRENVQKVIVGRDEAINLTLVAVLVRRSYPAGRCARHRENDPGAGPGCLPGLLLPAHPVYARPAAFGCDRLELVQPEECRSSSSVPGRS